MEYPKWKENGKIKLMIIVGTRPEIIRLAAVIKKCRRYFDTILVHTGQNYDYNLNGVFFKDLGLADPELYLDAVGADLGETMGNIIAASYKAMVELRPDAVLVLGDTNSCLSVIGAKRLHIPIFHMEAGNRCKAAFLLPSAIRSPLCASARRRSARRRWTRPASSSPASIQRDCCSPSISPSRWWRMRRMLNDFTGADRVYLALMKH